MIKNLVSVIIPCYNEKIYISEALDSVLNQSYDDIEVIVVDDGSSDGSKSVVRSYGDDVQLLRQENRGAPAARNRGLETAMGEYVKFLDADDVLIPGSLQQQVHQAEGVADKGKKIVFGDAVWVDENGNKLDGYGDLRKKKPDEDPVTHILYANPLTSSPLHRREYLLDVGGFNTTIPGPGDENDLHLRLALSGVEFVYRPTPVYYFRQHDNTERISERSYAEQGVMSHYELLIDQRRLIQEKHGSPLPEEVCEALARSLWSHGRAILREGHTEAAREYFTEARKMARNSDYIEGGMFYRLLNSIGGPLVAESVMSGIKSALR
jgi:glycosyltransferase involved in cell wall biosynthesis